jgi:hypothetical protein
MSISTVEIRAYSGPDLVELQGVNRPAIVRLNVGPKGDDGTSATVSVGTTTTGAAGTNASVTNSGTTSAAVFNFTIPRGNTGATGPNSVTSATSSDGTAVLSVEEVVAIGSGNRIVGIYAPDEGDRSGSLKFSDGVNSVGIIMAENSPTADLVLPSSSGTIALTSDIPPQEVKSSNFTAANKGAYVATATLTVTDPTPSEGASFSVLVRNGTATVGGTAYAVAGTLIRRIYHSGAWANYVYDTINGVATLTNKTISGASNTITNVPISTGISGLGTNVATFLATPLSANLAAAVTDETGTGSLVFGTSPTITTPAFTRSGTGNIFTGGDGTRTVTSLIGSYGVEMVISAATGTEGAYFRGIGNFEAWVHVTAQSNTSGLRAMRFGNRSNRFSIQRLTDNEASITATPFSFANDAPTNAFYMVTSGTVGFGTSTPSEKALLDLTSTTKGFLPPRMTTANRDAITSVPAGLMIYNTSTNKLNFYNGSAWEAVTSA